MFVEFGREDPLVALANSNSSYIEKKNKKKNIINSGIEFQWWWGRRPVG